MPIISRRALLGGGASAAMAAFTAPRLSYAAQWPEKQVTLIIPYGPGSATGFVARTFAEEMSKRRGATIIVENRPGASGVIGLRAIATARPDGFTIGMTSPDLSMNQITRSNLPYEWKKNLVPIGRVVHYFYALVTAPAFPAQNVQEFIDLLKSKPGHYTFGSAGDFSRVGAQFFSKLAGVKFIVVPFDSGSEMETAVLGGHVDFALDVMSSSLPLIKSGGFRPLAVTSPKRLDVLPNVPSLQETLPTFNYESWLALVAPGGVPESIINDIQTQVAEIFALPDVVQKAQQLNLIPVMGGTPQEMIDVVDREVSVYGQLAEDAGIEKQ